MLSESDFIEVLMQRVNEVRNLVELDTTKQCEGSRFKDTLFAVEGIQGALMQKQNPRIPGLVLQETMKLDFSVYQVLNGDFDPLILSVLKHLATMDYQSENRIDLH